MSHTVSVRAANGISFEPQVPARRRCEAPFGDRLGSLTTVVSKDRFFCREGDARHTSNEISRLRRHVVFPVFDADRVFRLLMRAGLKQAVYQTRESISAAPHSWTQTSSIRRGQWLASGNTETRERE